MWLASPACQPYTVLGLGKGAADPRAASFLHLMNVILRAMVERETQPEYILVENVAGFEVVLASNCRLSLTSPVLRYQDHGAESFG
jgi:C-5 cytosine-specific DNA methylase